MIFNQYPYLNLNDLNLDYIMKAIKEMRYEVTNFVSINAIKYADPIQWNITSQYEKNTIVIDPVTGTAYISVAPVPAGVALTRPEYWTVVFDLGSFVTRAAQNFTSRWESDTTLTATFPTNTGEWLVWGDVLYKALVNIAAGDTYVVGSNIEHFTIEDLYNAYLNTVAQILAMIGDLVDLNTSDKTSIVNAINSVISDYTAADTALSNDYNSKIGSLASLNTTDKTSTVAAINEVLQDIEDYNVVNAITAGIVPNSNAAAAANTVIMQGLLDAGKFVYFPNNHYVFNDTLHITRHSGIIGESMYGTIFDMYTQYDGILVDIDIEGEHSEIIDRVWYTFVLKNFGIHSMFYPNSVGNGIHLRNYTYEVTCNFDADAYAAIKGDYYAAEFRNSPIEGIHVDGFQNGVKTGFFLAYVLLNNMFIDSCTYYGLYNGASDSIFHDLCFTFCYNGVWENSQANKFTNICIKMCGYRASYDSQFPITGSTGFHVHDTERDMYCNFEIQECYAIGAYFENARNIILEGFVVDANGFNAASAGTSDVGLEILDGSYNIIGNVIAADKNTPPTQRLGMYVSNDCHDIQIRYTEHNQKNSIYTLGDSKQTMKALATTFLNKMANLTHAQFVAAPRAVVEYDGHYIHLDIHGYFNGNISANDTIFDWSSIFPTALTGYYATGRTDCVLINYTDGTFYKAYIDNVSQLKAGEFIEGGKQLALDITVPVWLTA